MASLPLGAVITIVPLNEQNISGDICRVPSNYGYLNLVTSPLSSHVYTIYKSTNMAPYIYHVQMTHAKDTPIGFELIEAMGGEFFTRISQVGFEPQRVSVSRVDTPK
jgi:hypothetical protein